MSKLLKRCLNNLSVSLQLGDEHDQALPDPSLWRVVKASAPEWYLIVIGVIASAGDGATFPLISVFMGELFEVNLCVESVVYEHVLHLTCGCNINHITQHHCLFFRFMLILVLLKRREDCGHCCLLHLLAWQDLLVSFVHFVSLYLVRPSLHD